MIRYFGYGITIDSGALDARLTRMHMSEVKHALVQLSHSATGRCLFRELQRTHRSIVIQPYESKNLGDVNASADPDDLKAAYLRGRPLRDGQTGNLVGGKGTGKGSSVHIKYKPWLYGDLTAAMLIHEMTHAAEEARGVMYLNKLAYKFDTTAEFDAIVVENMFRSETGILGRPNHHQEWLYVHLEVEPLHQKLIPELEAYKRLLRSFRFKMPAFVSDLAGVPARYNPYRKGAEGFVPL